MTPVTRRFTPKGDPCTRTQFSITLAWVVTIHKYQDLTMNRVVIDIGLAERTAGPREQPLFSTAIRLPAASKIGEEDD